MSEVHGEGYACGHCGKQFARRKHLNSHIVRIRRNLAKKSKQIYFEHEMTMPEVKEEESKGDFPDAADSSDSDSSSSNRNVANKNIKLEEKEEESLMLELMEVASKR